MPADDRPNLIAGERPTDPAPTPLPGLRTGQQQYPQIAHLLPSHKAQTLPRRSTSPSS